MSFPQFNNFALPGDSIKWETEGYSFSAKLEPDTGTRPDEFECFTEKQKQAWSRDEWFFVGVVVSVSYSGIELLEHAASLWGIECNFPSRRKTGKNRYLAEVCQELQGEALARAKSERARIVSLLAA